MLRQRRHFCIIPLQAFAMLCAIDSHSVNAAEARWPFDFEDGPPAALKLQGAEVTDDRRQVLTGRQSLLADFTSSTGDWHEFLRTEEAVTFEKDRRYAVRFNYRVLNADNEEVRFYCMLKSRAGKGDVTHRHWRWRMPTDWRGEYTGLFQMPHNGGYYLVLGVYKNGAIVVDDLEIHETSPNPGAASVEVKTHRTEIPRSARTFEGMRQRDGLDTLLQDMLIIVLNEGAGGKANNRKDAIVKDLQPDFVDWNVFGPLAKEYGIRSSSGRCEYQEYYRTTAIDCLATAALSRICRTRSLPTRVGGKAATSPATTA